MDVKDFLKRQGEKSLLRFITCGSVDDGKSTLIGRLLYDSKAVFEDKLSSLKNESKKYGTTNDGIDFALLVDGLQSEREQGITIDVAYLFFATEAKKYIIADTPGHEQYTRNMATGASTADVAVILVDARKGILAQTKRHSYIASLLGIKHLIVAINKMDLVGYSKDIFLKIKAAYNDEITSALGIEEPYFVPISALKGDNIVTKSENTEWFEAKALLEYLDGLQIEGKEGSHFRFPVQYVNRPNLDFRGFAGTVASGELKAGDRIKSINTQKTTLVKEIIQPPSNTDENKRKAVKNDPITIVTADEIDIGRGDILVLDGDDSILYSDTFEADIVWMGSNALKIGYPYEFRGAFGGIGGSFEVIKQAVDINTYGKNKADTLQLNDIGTVTVKLDRKTGFDPYDKNKATGSFIVIDKNTNDTIGAGMIRGVDISSEKIKKYSDFEIEFNGLVRKYFPHWECKEITQG